MNENASPLKFTFSPRWKEELVCSSPAGSFVIEMTMGVISVYCPTERKWKDEAPAWAKNYWGVFKDQLEKWCTDSKIPLYIDEAAWVAND